MLPAKPFPAFGLKMLKNGWGGSDEARMLFLTSFFKRLLGTDPFTSSGNTRAKNKCPIFASGGQ